MERSDYIFTDETLELSCVVKTICDSCDISAEELHAIPSFGYTLDLEGKICIKKRIPIEIPIPKELAPRKGKNSHLRLIRSRAIGEWEHESPAVSVLDKMESGLAECEMKGDRKIKFWCWRGPQDYYMIGGSNLFFVQKKDFTCFIKSAKKWMKEQKKSIDPPILPEQMLLEIYNNSVGFLLKGREMKQLYNEYKIPYKRGILLCGKPGCGKTLTCKWLRELCNENSLGYKIVGMEQYRDAQSRGRLRSLFRLRGKKLGIIFFDDMDVMVKNRKDSINTSELSTFLSELDGIDPVEGVVFVFTTNYIKELDEAFVRPGRIDLWLRFHAPTKKMRSKFIKEKFDAKILESICFEDLEKRMASRTETESYTFAEMEEIRKLFCMDLINDLKLDANKTFKTFDKHRKEFEERAKIQGFGKLEDDEEDDYDDDGIGEPFPWSVHHPL